jgi:hypothetical protein
VPRGKKISAEGRKEKRGVLATPRDRDEIPPGKQKPLFSFHYLNRDYCLSQCNAEEKAAFADTMYKLSQLTWNQIDCAPRHGLGYEKIARYAINSSIPPHVTEDVNFIAFRFYSMAPMVGYRDRNVFHVIWFDRAFRLYSHGS